MLHTEKGKLGHQTSPDSQVSVDKASNPPILDDLELFNDHLVLCTDHNPLTQRQQQSRMSFKLNGFADFNFTGQERRFRRLIERACTVSLSGSSQGDRTGNGKKEAASLVWFHAMLSRNRENLRICSMR